MSIPSNDTQYGFQWGPALVERCISDKSFGVIVTVKTQKFPKGLRVRISEAGNVWVNNERVIADKPE